MKKILIPLFASILIVSCTDNDKKPGTTLVTPVADTTKVIDTTIIEDGIAPIADNEMARNNGVVVNQYSNGKTMGVSYYVPLGLWVTGTSSLSCAEQCDPCKLQTALGLK